MLEKAHHQNTVVAANDVFGAVTVVHIKVHNRHALQAVALQRIFGCHCHAVDKTKAHGPVAAGMVAGRTYRAKSVFHFASHHRVGGGQHSAGSAQHGAPAVHIEGRVRVQLCVAGTAGCNFFGQLL